MTLSSSLPLTNKIGWPWSSENSIDTHVSLVDREYPKITVLTPNYNYGHYLEETIRSVLLQDYPDLKYANSEG